jgi:imidazole glycerol-phosphate synthase subunit HisF
MLTKRIIPCLDLKDGRVVKGKRFLNLQEAGDPVTLAKAYEEGGADELVILDISATIEERATSIEVIKEVARHIGIPLTVGGGIRTLSDIRHLLSQGVDKVAINTAALIDPMLIKEASGKFGSQCIVLAIDVKRTSEGWQVFSHAGTVATDKDALEWALQGQNLGAGELLVTSIDRDGTKEGYDLELIRALSDLLQIPIIASGGVGKWEDIRDAFLANADAALAASLFHFGSFSVNQVKSKLQQQNIHVRL